MALIRGVGSLFPCPRCLIPEAKQGDLSARAPLQTVASTKATIQEAREQELVRDREELLKASGLRDVDVWNPHSSHFSFCTAANDTSRRTFSGRLIIPTHTLLCLSIVSILCLVACFTNIYGNVLRSSLRNWVGKLPLK